MTSVATQSIHRILKDVWGYEAFRPLQRESIESVLATRDSLTVLPTGGGKSLCFQVPAVAMDGLAIVVSPLISLMKDQVDALNAVGVEAAYINSSQTAAEKRTVAEQIDRREIKLLYVAPERLVIDRTLDFLSQQPLSFFAIDESHCISNWGHDFRPEYRSLDVLRERFPTAGIHAYTATASERVRYDIVGQLKLRDPHVLVGNFDRPNLTYRVLPGRGKLDQISAMIDRHRGESGIIYCISRREVEQTANSLASVGHKALPYHAGLTDQTRKEHQDAFIAERCDIIVATVAFGMGIDKSNVRYVIHAGMPKSIEHYQQESGRAGRDGLPSECVLLHSRGDIITWKKLLENPSDGASDQQALAAAFRSLDAMDDFCTSITCRHRTLVEHFGQSFDSENCGACDVCLGEIAMVDDPLTLAQKIISCVYRLEQRFGASHTADVLVGSTKQRVVERGHDQLSTFGLLSDHSPATIRQWISQLISQDCLERSGEFQVLAITGKGRQVLRGEHTPMLSTAMDDRRRTTKSTATKSDDSWEGVDQTLFEELRRHRRELAEEAHVPAFVVFGDATLRELARCRPSTLDGFARVKGVGQKKLADYGQTFLERINEICGRNNLTQDQWDAIARLDPETSEPTANTNKPSLPKGAATAAFAEFRQGKSIAEVAEKIGRATSTTEGYLIDFLKAENVTDASPWVDDATQQTILDNRDKLDEGRLKPLFEHLDGHVSYHAIRITLTCHQNQERDA
ncbi:MAG: DNA helicase RecQ [Planctomycetota bacterium]